MEAKHKHKISGIKEGLRLLGFKDPQFKGYRKDKATINGEPGYWPIAEFYDKADPSKTQDIALL